MLLLRKPEPYSIRQFLNRQATAPFTYLEVGATQGELPRGYALNHVRAKLGRGTLVFNLACQALREWQQLQLGWVECWPKNAPLEAGEPVAVIGRAFGLWWLNACRVVYTVDDRDHPPRFGYAHGTLADHLAIGEERFLVEMSPDESVWIDIKAFSRPNTLVARLGYPLIRRAQKRFGQQSVAKLAQYVDSELRKSERLEYQKEGH